MERKHKKVKRIFRWAFSILLIFFIVLFCLPIPTYKYEATSSTKLLLKPTFSNNLESDINQILMDGYGFSPMREVIDSSPEPAYNRGTQLQLADLVQNMLGYDFHRSLAMVESGWVSSITDRIDKKPTAMAAIKHAYLFGYFLQRADGVPYNDDFEKAMQNRVGFDDWNFIQNGFVKASFYVGKIIAWMGMNL